MQKDENSKCVVVFLSVSGENLHSQRWIPVKGKSRTNAFRLFDLRLFGKSSSFSLVFVFFAFSSFSSFRLFVFFTSSRVFQNNCG